MSLHGISRNAWPRDPGYYEIEDAGFKYNMTDLAAAIGVVQLSRAQELLRARQELAARYTTRLANSMVSDPPQTNSMVRTLGTCTSSGLHWTD